MKRPRCFIAMAFDHPDTDALYDKKILPVLRRNNIAAVIINRRESTRDLNKQIIEQLEASDLCITDLTYARPSVYYEAGYAERVIPVIYTVRNDHVAPRSSPDGRVHFDLTMKPLVRWDSPKDKTFSARLERRIRGAFLRDWKRRQDASDELDAARREFSRLSVAGRLGVLRRIARNAFKRVGFGKWSYEKTPDPIYDHVVYDDGTGFWVGWRHRGRALTMVKVKAVDALTKRRITHLLPSLAWHELQFALDHARNSGVRPARLVVHCLVIVLQPVSTVRLESGLHNLPAGERPGQYVVTMNLEDRSSDDRRKRPLVPTVATLDCIAPVKSEAEFRPVLKTLIPALLADI